MKREQTEREENPGRVSLAALLKEVGFKEGRFVPKSVKEIVLGEMGLTAEQLVARTLVDPEHRERGRVVYLLPSRELIMQVADTVGQAAVVENFGSGMTTTRNEVALAIEIKTSESTKQISRHLLANRQERYVAGMIHSHPVDGLPSDEDMSDLLLEEPEVFGALMAFVVTPNRKIVVMRSESTPEFEHGRVGKIIEAGMINGQFKRLAGVISGSQVGCRDETFVEFVRRFNLRVFVCKLRENVARSLDVEDGDFLARLNMGR